jgi:peroxiredoxin
MGRVTTDGKSPLRQRPTAPAVRMREIAEARRLHAELRDRELPCLELTTADSMRLPLQAHISGIVVMYFLPGETGEAASIDEHPTLDAAQHSGYVKYYDAFRALEVKVFSVSSQPVDDLARMRAAVDATHLMFSDPELLIGQALGLPIDGSTPPRYRRMTLIADGGRIKAAIPTKDSEAAESARQALIWLAATYHESSHSG